MGGRRSRHWRRSVFGRDVTPPAGTLALWIGGLIALQSPQGLQAAEPPVDPSLLEFLGSVDSEDKNWHEYLASTDIDRLAKRAVHAQGSPACGAAAARACERCGAPDRCRIPERCRICQKATGQYTGAERAG